MKRKMAFISSLIVISGMAIIPIGMTTSGGQGKATGSQSRGVWATSPF